MIIRRALLIVAILFFSFFAIYGSMGGNQFLAFFPFLMSIIAGLILYQSFDRWVPQTSIGIIGFFMGRLLFIGLLLYVDYVVSYSIRSNKIQKDGISTYGIATGISSRYLRGKRDFYRHFSYVANGRVLQNKIRFSYELNRGDTLYLKYSKSNPYVIEFEDNSQNRKHGVVK
ncbi:hypothetical protein [Dyadobacter pollutisoli]|jgi:hypothetical protein|uniref:DUF3592 domain-containing protein n=1 Tax=Dyadobacter pollutisoli TaxID=2910158 RepID=A0A9E8NBS6_9BACT|nr:hypothetical protein [Dyadobacter pollutisoli]WAC11487.1 hypothetical protein ON006_27625 [Dyadobacter pollutisoli]